MIVSNKILFCHWITLRDSAFTKITIIIKLPLSVSVTTAKVDQPGYSTYKTKSNIPTKSIEPFRLYTYPQTDPPMERRQTSLRKWLICVHGTVTSDDPSISGTVKWKMFFATAGSRKRKFRQLHGSISHGDEVWSKINKFKIILINREQSSLCKKCDRICNFLVIVALLCVVVDRLFHKQCR